MDSNDEIHAEQIRSLPLWSRPIRLEPLDGGITNRNYLVDDAGERYVARIGAELLILGIDRRNEAQCHRAAQSLGVAPPLVYGDNGVLVSRFIPSRTLDAAGACESGVAPRLAEVLRQLHEGWDGLVGEILFFCPFQASRTYVATSRRLGADLPADTDEMLETARRLSRTIAPYTPTLCHNDLLPANILDDGDRIWIVDWEYAGMGNPLFDLAGISANCGYSEDQEIALLKSYRGELRQQDLYELRVLKVASLLRDVALGRRPDRRLGPRFRLSPIRPYSLREIPIRPDRAHSSVKKRRHAN